MNTLFSLFLRDKKYLKNVSETTLEFYQYSFLAFQKHGGELSKAGIQAFVINMKEAGMSTGAANAYIRGVNSFLSWLYENEHITEHLRVKPLKQEKRVMKTFSDEEVSKLVSYKPKDFYDSRMHALVCLMVDTGIRIDEAITLTREKVDFNNLLVTVIGKGNKERIVPMSPELRKILFKWLQKNPHTVVFSTKDGGKKLYDNLRQDFLKYLDKVGVEKKDGSFHSLRRKYARSYVKSGGNLFYLMTVLGHASLRTTQAYVEVETEDLQATHLKTSLLTRLR
jgi:integrase/recombinase XerD